MFAIPWHGHTVVGTTDTPVAQAAAEPVAMEEEIEFILQTAALYLAKAPSRADVLSVFAGIRPLVKHGDGGRTASLSRDHTILIEDSGIVTIAGGKWTTYRHMAEDCVNQAATLAGLEERPCVTADLAIHGSHRGADAFGPLSVYGSDAPAVRELSGDRSARFPALHVGRGFVGGAAGDGADSGGCAGTPHARAVSQRARRRGDGPGRGRPDGRRVGARWRLDRGAGTSHSTISHAITYLGRTGEQAGSPVVIYSSLATAAATGA